MGAMSALYAERMRGPEPITAPTDADLWVLWIAAGIQAGYAAKARRAQQGLRAQNVHDEGDGEVGCV